MVAMKKRITEAAIYSRGARMPRTAQPRAGKEWNQEQYSPNWREIIKAPKAVMAAASMDITRSSVAMECSAHSESARNRGRCCEEEEERKEDGDCQVDPGPTCQQSRR